VFVRKRMLRGKHAAKVQVVGVVHGGSEGKLKARPGALLVADDR
jgi:hypothetical protein